MASTRILKTAISDPYDARIKAMWIQGYGEKEHEFEPFYVVGSSDTEDERRSYISGLGQWTQKNLGEPITYDTIYQGYDTTLTHAEYTSAFTIEEVTVEDEPHGLFGGQLAANLSAMGKYTAEVLAAVQFNTGFTSTTVSPWMAGGDGQYFFDTDHTILSGGVYPNKPATDVDFSVTSLQAGITNMRKTQDARGNLWPLQPKMVVAPIDSEWLVGEILGSKNMPYTPDNTPNLAAKGLTPHFWSHLTDTDCWFLGAGKPAGLGDKGIATVMFWRVKPEFDRDNAFETGDRKYKGRMRLSFGRWDHRGWYGSSGG